ncbi:MAG: O-antigen ligase family protein [Bacteroidia bacterium]|nr:O-antigen ligase family protein [Bacteroidia bacterium]
MKNYTTDNWQYRLALGFMILTVAVLPFIFPMSTLDPALYPRMLGLSLILLLTIGILVFRHFFSPDHSRFIILYRLIFIFYIAYFICTGLSLFAAVNTGEAFTEWMKTGVYLVFFLVTVLILIEIEEPQLIFSKIISVFTIFAAVAGYIQFIIIAMQGHLSHEATYLVRIPFGHRNLFSEILFLCLPFTAYGIYRFRKTWLIISIFATMLSLGLITLLLSKSAWAAIVISMVVALLTLGNYYNKFSLQKKNLTRFALYFGLSVAVIISGMFIYGHTDSFVTLKKQTGWLTNYKFGSSLERVDLWTKSMDMYRDHPAFGVGAGNWKINLPKYGLEDIAAEDSTNRSEDIVQGKIIFQQPHNDMIWVLTETGLPGFLFYAAIFFMAFYYIFLFFKRSQKTGDKYFMLFMLAGITGYLVIALVSFPKERIEHSVMLNFILAFIVVVYHRDNTLTRKVHSFIPLTLMVAGILISLMSSLVSLIRVNEEIHLKRAFRYRELNKQEMVVDEINKAYSVFANLDNTSTPLKWYSGSAYFNMGLTAKALEDFKTAYSDNPWHIHVLNNLATCYELEGNHPEAEKLYAQALKISPSFEDSAINLSIMYYYTHRIDQAYESIKRVKTGSRHENYHQALDAVLMAKIKACQTMVSEECMKKSLDRILNAAEWYEKVFRQAINDKNNYEKQLIIECIYLMEIVDKSITPEYAKELKLKYGLISQEVK